MTRKPIVTRFHLFLLGLLAAITAAAFFKISPDMGLPVHWGFDGRPDRVWPRNEALVLFPIVAVCLTGLFLAIGQFVPSEQVEPGLVEVMQRMGELGMGLTELAKISVLPVEQLREVFMGRQGAGSTLEALQAALRLGSPVEA